MFPLSPKRGGNVIDFKKILYVTFWSKISEYQGKTDFLKPSVDHIKNFQKSEWQWMTQQHYLK